MFDKSIEYLKDPRLVARIQEFFGVRIHHRKEDSKSDDKSGEKSIKKNGFVNSSKESNGHCNNDKTLRNGKNHVQNKEQNEIEDSEMNFTITNHFWYYLFLFGTELGDETFYSLFITFWFWNIDGAVGRRVVLVWAIVMTIGQGLKDIIRWPRPSCPPAVRLQSKWTQEYGMPSTHAMIGIAIPFSVVLFTSDRYIYPWAIGWTIAILWCSLVSMSRLYLGMHTVLDVVAGLALAILLMAILVPFVDYTDHYFLTEIWAISILAALSIATIIYYPSSDRWTPTRNDTAMVVSVATGVHVGAWLNFNTGVLSAPLLPPPYSIIWPSYPMLGLTILRTIIGFCCILGGRAVCKSLSYATMCAILRVNSKELKNSEDSLDNRNKIIVDLVYKYITCFMIGFNTVYLLPNVFTILGIERPNFYTEV